MVDIRDALEKKTPGSKRVHERSHEVLANVVAGTLEMPHPVYIKEAKGSRVTDVDGNEYIDLTMGYGPHILGHAPDVVIDAVKEAADRGLQWALHNPYQEPLASLVVDAVPCADKVLFCNTGTEATMTAIRGARAFTGKKKIGLFDGSYHGSHDSVLVDAQKESPREAPTFQSRGGGIPEETLDNVIMLPYREAAAFDIIREHKDELAVVLLEPVQSSNPRMDQGDFLKELLNVCRESDVLFLMDEVITGFRMAYGGAQEVFDITPDIATYGKILGGGLPIGAVAGRADIMEVFSRRPSAEETSGDEPVVRSFAAGTFSGNPMTMAAGYAAIRYLRDHPESYRYLAEQSARLVTEVNEFCMAQEIPATLMAGLSQLHMRIQTGGPIESSRDIDDSLKDVEQELYMHLMNHGVLLPGTHLFFTSTAHTPEDIDKVIDAFKQSFTEMKEKGLI